MEYQGYDDPRTENIDLGMSQETNTENVDNSQLEGEQPQGDSQQVAQNQFDPKAFEMNYKGQLIYPNDKQHLINLAQQGHSYSQNMEKLNAQQKEIEEQKSVYGHYKTLDEAMQNNPVLNQKITQLYQDHTSGKLYNNQQEQPQEGYEDYADPRVNQLETKLQDMEKWREEEVGRKADQELDNAIDELKKKYPDQPWDKDTGDGTLQQRLIKHAIDKDINDIGLAYRDLMFDNLTANVQSETLLKHKETLQKNHQNGIVGTGHGVTQQNQLQYSPDDDYGDLTQKAIKSLGG